MVEQYTGIILKDGSRQKLSTIKESLITGNYYNPYTASGLGLKLGATAKIGNLYYTKNGGYWGCKKSSSGNDWFEMQSYDSYAGISTSWDKSREYYTIGGGLNNGIPYIFYIEKVKNDDKFYISIIKGSSNNDIAYKFFNGIADSSDDPFIDGGTATTGGGGGDFDNTSQPVDFPDLPSFNIFNTALITAYNMNYRSLHELRAFLWSADLLDNLKKFYSDPFDLIVSLNILPFDVPTGGEENIIFGNVKSNVVSTVVTNQFIWVDCGVIHLNEYWGAYLDYNPYTKLSIVLPYIGTRQLNIDECMGKDIHVKYMVDILTGSCVAHIKCGDSVMYTFGGTCAVQLPLSSANYSDIYASIVRGLGGATLSAMSGNVAGAGMELANTAISTVSSKPQYARNGSVTSNTGFMSHQYPYLILERPKQCLPMNQNKLDGYPSFISAKMSDLSGFNIIHSCHLENLSCTDSEKSELMNILKEGVIF